MKFTLINPTIYGNLKNMYSGKTALDAAKNSWQVLSKYIINPVYKFPFTLRNNETNELSHYLLEEKPTNNNVEYEIKEISVEIPKRMQNKLVSITDNVQRGGRTVDDNVPTAYDIMHASKSHYNQQPITYFWYDPTIYKLPRVYFPTFSYRLNPVVEIATVSYYPNQ